MTRLTATLDIADLPGFYPRPRSTWSKVAGISFHKQVKKAGAFRDKRCLSQERVWEFEASCLAGFFCVKEFFNGVFFEKVRIDEVKKDECAGWKEWSCHVPGA